MRRHCVRTEEYPPGYIHTKILKHLILLFDFKSIITGHVYDFKSISYSLDSFLILTQ